VPEPERKYVYAAGQGTWAASSCTLHGRFMSLADDPISSHFESLGAHTPNELTMVR